MLILTLNGTDRKNYQDRSDLTKLLFYLFSPKDDFHSETHQGIPIKERLLGPPEIHALSCVFSPVGSQCEDACRELSSQIYTHALCSSVGEVFPRTWFSHVLITFTRKTNGLLRKTTGNATVPKFASPSQNAIRIAKDALHFLGWEEDYPTVFVVHGDTANTHVHAVIAICRPFENKWQILNLEKDALFEAAKIASDAFDIRKYTSRVRFKYRLILGEV